MMTGEGPFGPVEMGGMFSVLKVRRDQKPGDYSSPAWFQHPPGTVASEFTSAMADAQRSGTDGGVSMPRDRTPADSTEVQVRKPGAHGEH
jgi:hypothetical protein